MTLASVGGELRSILRLDGVHEEGLPRPTVRRSAERASLRPVPIAKALGIAACESRLDYPFGDIVKSVEGSSFSVFEGSGLHNVSPSFSLLCACCKSRDSVGTKSRVATVANSNPPMTARASGASCSPFANAESHRYHAEDHAPAVRNPGQLVSQPVSQRGAGSRRSPGARYRR